MTCSITERDLRKAFPPRLNFKSAGAKPPRRPRIVTSNIFPPIPQRQFDWIATLDDYEPGAPQGFGRTEEEAIADLREILADA
jgi:hypothetical protein